MRRILRVSITYCAASSVVLPYLHLAQGVTLASEGNNLISTLQARCPVQQPRCLFPCTSNTSNRSGRCVRSRTYETRPSHSPQSKDDLMYHLTAHLRMNAIYWGLTALCIMGHQNALDREEMIEFVMSCWDDEAG